MSVSRGLLRIVLLRSGGYDYAELDLHRPIHLVAGNNVGKTTLIAALQFLYIDDSRQMHFAHKWRETKQHYFPDSGSFVLFECMTPTGLQVFGLRGQGPVQGFEYDRFGYNGAYERDDFLDGRTPRPWSEVSRRLLTRELRPMEPRHLRASLTGSGDAKRPPLGLVPLKRSGSYDSFRFLFRNLLRLSRIEQKQLKELFIDISRPRLRQVEVDIKRDYAEMFARVEKDAQDVQALREVAPDIAALVTGFAERKGLRTFLVATWQRIERALENEGLQTRDAVAGLEKRSDEVAASLLAIESRQRDTRTERESMGAQRGRLGEQRDVLETLKARTRDFIEELEAAGRLELQKQLDELVTRLAGAARADRSEVVGELSRRRRQLAADERLVARYSDALVSWLRGHTGLTDEALSDVFTVVNPALLGEVVGRGRVELADSESVASLARRIAGAFDDAGFAAHGVRIRRPGAGEPSPLADYQDIGVVRKRVAGHERRIKELKQILADLDERAELERQRRAAEEKLDAAKARLRDWEEWGLRRQELDELKLQLEALAVHGRELEERENGLALERTRLALEQTGFKKQMAELSARHLEQAEQVQQLSAPPTAWPIGETEDDGESSPNLGDLLRSYRSEFGRHQRLDTELSQRFASVEHKTAGRHQGGDEAETISRLSDELEALESRQKAVQDLWSSLVDGMRSAFKSLVEAVDEVRREVSRLTTALGRRQVSNLERVELQLVKQRDLIGRLSAVIDAEESPLFAGAGGRARAARDIQTWLETKPRIELAELFDLRFRIVDVRGQTKTFDSLSQIESQGTSTTIKVLVHLELLRSMLVDDGVAVPFFLDEVATLDGANLRALIEHATSMGFVPVVASPEARDCVDTLYFLRRGEGGLVLDETSRVRLHRESTDAS